jgi:hypothetical protein
MRILSENIAAAATLEVVALDDTLKALAAVGANHVDTLAIGEDRHADWSPGLTDFATSLEPHFPPHPCRRHARLLEVPAVGLFSCARGLPPGQAAPPRSRRDPPS